jgi:hypothetical protein
MTEIEQIGNNHLPNARRIPEYTLEYLDAHKEAVRKEKWSGRNWLRTLIYLPYIAAMIMIPKLQIFWPYKFCIYVVFFGFCHVLYVRAFNRAVLKRLNAELRAPED